MLINIRRYVYTCILHSYNECISCDFLRHLSFSRQFAKMISINLQINYGYDCTYTHT